MLSKFLQKKKSKTSAVSKPKKAFDAAMAAQMPHDYNDTMGEVYVEEDFLSKESTAEIRKKIVQDYYEYWRGLEKYLGDEAKVFKKSIDNIKKISLENFDHPCIRARVEGKRAIEVKLSRYNRLFAEIKIGSLSEFDDYGKLSIVVLKHYLSRYIGVWETRGLGKSNRGYGKDLHLRWGDDNTLYFCTTFEEHKAGDLADTESEYKWFSRIIKIVNDLASEKIVDFETYSPAEYKKFINGLNLVGRTITGVKDNNFVISYDKATRFIELSGDFIISLDDGRIIGFKLDSASHPSVNFYDEWSVLENSDIVYDGTTIRASEMYSYIIGSKITKVNINTSKNIDDLLYAYEDPGFNDGQGEFIIRLQLVIDDENMIEIEAGTDWTDVSINPYY